MVLCSARAPAGFQIEQLPTETMPGLRLELFKFDYVSKEAEAADSALGIDREGRSTLDLLRKCEESSEWTFFATRPDQKFCSPKCRQKALEKTEKFKKSEAVHEGTILAGAGADLRNRSRTSPRHGKARRQEHN